MRVFLLLSVVAFAFASPDCGENAHFETCGTACPLTCENYKNPPKFCILRCDIGCHCDEGYVKTADGRCVLPEQCPSSARPVEKNCVDEPDKMCLAYNPIWYYDARTRKCYKLRYGGCGGYENKWASEEECMQNCASVVEKNCIDKPESGRCLAYFPSWYYDAKAQKCYKFIYGGCGGNGNRYESEEECMQKCSGVTELEGAATDACNLPSESGVCRGFFTRYYFDRTTGQCEKFVYGGCGGNENNFETIEECQRKCGSAAPSACLQEKVTGPCRGLFPRFYYNKETGECEKFVYGGCQGNSNNFHSQEDCEAVCKA